MKKVWISSLILLVYLTTHFCAFSDLASSHWAYESVMSLTQLGIISGMPDGTFKGNDPMTRYQSAVAMKRILDYTSTQTGGSTQIPSDLFERLSELENLVNQSLNAVQKAGEDYRQIMKKLEQTTGIPDAGGGYEYEELDRLVEEILEVKWDAKNIEADLAQTHDEIEQLKGSNQDMLNRLDEQAVHNREMNLQLAALNLKTTRYQWVAVCSAIIAAGSFLMAGYVLLK
ncbi:MAG TPA: S-layer homology domain-containing protein [Thermotogota bacterium]|nr:S-layer homology domain-containing protein [Thermotogota bacterium]HRW34973.1 S-layer homology domain-containing protein [Thermotogota bacterium]